MTTQTISTNIQSDLEKTFNDLLGLLESFTHEQLNQLPFEGSWTAGQVGDHLSKSYAVLDSLQSDVREGDREADQHCQSIKELFLNFNLKFESNPFILPSGGPFDKTALLGELKIATHNVLEFASKEELGMIATGFEVPGWGYLSRLEWMTLFRYHTQRHLHQLVNIKQIITHQ